MTAKEELSNEELVRQFCAGNSHYYFGLIYDRFADKLYARAVRILGDRDDAEDVLQNAFTKAYFYLKGLKEPHKLEAWLKRIVSNCCWDKIKENKYDNDPEKLDYKLDKQQVDSFRMLRNETQDMVESVLMRLSPDQRLLLTKKYVDGYSLEDLAELMGTNANHIKVLIFRSKKAFIRNYDILQKQV